MRPTSLKEVTLYFEIETPVLLSVGRVSTAFYCDPSRIAK